MRCCESPTISIAAEPLAAGTASVREVMNAILFREILKPLAAALGPVGEVALGTVADGLFVRPAR